MIALAAGVPVASFSGGVEANSYLKQRGFEIEPLHLPTETEIKIGLHELLLAHVPNSVTLQEAYSLLAKHPRIGKFPPGKTDFETARVSGSRRSWLRGRCDFFRE